MVMDSKLPLKYARRAAPSLPDFEADGKPLGDYLVDKLLTCEVGTEKRELRNGMPRMSVSQQ
jgi:hypothetical protein